MWALLIKISSFHCLYHSSRRRYKRPLCAGLLFHLPIPPCVVLCFGSSWWLGYVIPDIHCSALMHLLSILLTSAPSCLPWLNIFTPCTNVQNRKAALSNIHIRHCRNTSSDIMMLLWLIFPPATDESTLLLINEEITQNVFWTYTFFHNCFLVGVQWAGKAIHNRSGA